MSRLCCVIDMSVSRTIPAAVVDRLSAMHPTLDIRYRNLVAAPPPHISLRLCDRPGSRDTRRVSRADIVVIGAPMYNFGIATQLKASAASGLSRPFSPT